MQLYPIVGYYTWVAIDELANYQFDGSKRGSFACRLLLVQLQHQLKLTGVLQQQDFPYYFDTQEGKRFFVSFSHSQRQIAIIISKYAHIGIDIEDGNISANVAQRFFADIENDWINSVKVDYQQKLRNLLWSLKECTIKANHHQPTSLTLGLKTNLIATLDITKINAWLHIQPSDNWQLIEQNQQLIGYHPNTGAVFIIQLSN